MAVSKRLRYEIFRRDNFKCRYCGATPSQAQLRVDHVVPEALGGKTDASNLVTSCDDCNSGKSSIAPDSPIVDDVRQDAMRWSRAQEAVAARMLADLEAKNALRSTFEEKWNAWKFPDGGTVPLPGSWINSVDNFMAVGLPLEVLFDCMDKAMGAEKVKPENVFRYMCGIAWSLVTEMQEATRAELGEKRDPDGGAGISGLAAEVLDMLTPIERKDAMRAAEATSPDARLFEPIEDQAAYVAIGEMDHHRSILAYAIDKLLATAAVPDHLLTQADAEVAERMGDDYTDFDIAANRIRHLTRAIGAGWVTL